MKLICVGVGPCRCLVLRFRKANILLDCATPLDSALCALGSDEARHGPAAGSSGDGGAVADGRSAVHAAESAAGGVAAPAGPNAATDGQAAVADAPPDTSAGGRDRSNAGSGGGGGCLTDLTPFLPLLGTLELHAALISSPQALMALPHLLQYGSSYDDEYDGVREGDPGGGSRKDGVRGGEAELGGGAGRGGSAGWGRSSAPPWHHLGPIRGPVYCTQAALDVAEQLVAERLAAEEAAEAAAEDDRSGRRSREGLSQLGPGGRRQQRQRLPQRPGQEAAREASCEVQAVQAAGQQRQRQPQLERTWQEDLRGSPAAALAAATAVQSEPRMRPPSSRDLGLDLPDHHEALLATCWRRRPPWRAVRFCLDRVRPVRYGQVVSLDSYELTAAPYPSGSGFGHAVWQIADGAERCRTVLYLPDVAPSHPFAPPLPLELLRAPDALLLGPDMLAPSLAPPPRPPHQAIKEAVLRAVVAGGSALVPVYVTGEAWELLESLAGALASADMPHVPLLYVGLRARPSLALAAVSLEALAPERQAAVYGPHHPFTFDSLMQARRLVTATSLMDPAAQRCLQQPAVVLAAADSLLYTGGPALQLLLRFAPDPRSLLLLPHAAPPAALRGIRRMYDMAAAAAAAVAAAPAPWRLRVVHAPLRGSGASCGPSPSVALDLLARLQPRNLLASSRDLELLRRQQQHLALSRPEAAAAPQGGGGGGGGGDAVNGLASLPPLARESVVPYGWLYQARVSLPRNVHGAVVAPELLQRLQWLGGGPGLQLARLNCLLVFRSGAWHADAVPGGSASADSVAAATAMAAGGAVAADQLLLAAAGRPALAELLGALAEHGVTRVAVAAEGESTRVSLEGTDAEVTLRPHGACIHTGCPSLRHMLTDCLTRQLTVL